MRQHAGFTIIDTLIALLVLEVALLGLAGVLASGERLLARGRQATRAAAQGRDLLARMARGDSVCSAASGSRSYSGASLTWVPEGSLALRRVTAVIERPEPLPAESLATVVHCP